MIKIHMAKFYTTSGLAAVIEHIIKEAQKEIILVSPYLQIHKLVMQRLIDASHKKVLVKVVYRKDSQNTKSEVEKLRAIETLQLYEIENLHAKCFLNEKRALISSMNLYDYSEKNNREMGIALSAAEDGILYKEAVAEVESIIRASTPVKDSTKRAALLKPLEREKKVITPAYLSKNTSYCIRCRKDMRYNFDKPLCNPCYRTWSSFANPDYEEVYCHKCGNESSTSFGAPLCYDCWVSSKNVRVRG